jgi:hypothetical protein
MGPRCRGAERQRAIHRHCALLAPDEVTVLDGIPVTSVHRTLFDYAGVSSVDRLEAAIRQAEYRRLRDRLSLPALLARYPGHRGNAVRITWRQLHDEPDRVARDLRSLLEYKRM